MNLARRSICSLIGAAWSLGQSNEGTELAPGWLRSRDLVSTLKQSFEKLEDLGDFHFYDDDVTNHVKLSTDQQLEKFSAYAQRLSQTLYQQLQNNRFVLTVGGDHSLGAATVDGVLKHNPNAKVIWVDAHADINTVQTSPSGNIHGMPVAMNLGLLKSPMFSQAYQWMSRLPAKNIVYIGLRDIDHGEIDIMNDLGIKFYTNHDVFMLGMKQVVTETINYLDPQGDSEFHLSFDVDAIDPIFVPSTGTPVKSGLSLNDSARIIKALRKTGRLLAMDLVEVNPRLGSEQDVKQTLHSVRNLLSYLGPQNSSEIIREMPIPLSKVPLFNSDFL